MSSVNPPNTSAPASAWRDALDPAERAAYEAGDLDAVITSTLARGRRDLTARVRELVWDFAAAVDDWRSVDALVDALRCAIEARDGARIEAVLAEIRGADVDTRRAAVALLERRGRRADAASITVTDDTDDVLRRARALERAGDAVAAAELLHGAGRDREALAVLGRLDERETHAARWALAAQLHWSLGDAEGTIRAAQTARRLGAIEERGARLLARALGSLGHDVAGELVLGSIPRAEDDETPALHGRYRVTRLAEASLVGTAYHAVDRTTLQEVEVHLLLGDRGEREDPDGRVRATLERFAAAAEGASRLGHPAIRPVLYVDPRLGVLILPRASGPTLDRHLSARRAVAPVQARAWVAFLLDGLALAHARGLVHGGPFPSSLVEDALGRPTLGPFGVDALAGLAVTRTATLQELLEFSAPEVRAGGAASPASDVWSVGRLLAALVLGTNELGGASSSGSTHTTAVLTSSAGPTSPGAAPPTSELSARVARATRSIDSELATLVATLCVADPQRRPTAAEARALVLARVADPTRLSGPSTRGSTPPSDAQDESTLEPNLVSPEHDAAGHDAAGRHADATRGRVAPRTSPLVRATPMGVNQAVEVDAARTWAPTALAGLTRLRTPTLQPILDRHEARFFLAGWPSGSALAPPDVALPEIKAGLRSTLDLDDDLRAAIEAIELRLDRLRHEAIVRTPSGEWFIALDALLAV